MRHVVRPEPIASTSSEALAALERGQIDALLGRKRA